MGPSHEVPYCQSTDWLFLLPRINDRGTEYSSIIKTLEGGVGGDFLAQNYNMLRKALFLGVHGPN
jgi:hypothetical protein